MSDFVIENSVLKKYTGKGGDVVIPEGVTEIGDEAFRFCSRLTSVAIPVGVTKIGRKAFCGCYSLASMTIPEGVTSIGSNAFAGCMGLTSVVIPESLTDIDSGAFQSCNGLQDKDGFVIVRGVLYDFLDKDATSVQIPDGVTSIEDKAFQWGKSLKSVTFPDSVTSIGSNIFGGSGLLYDCGLTDISLPASVKVIRKNAFLSCRSLTRMEIRGEGAAKAVVTALRAAKGADYFSERLLSGQREDSRLEKAAAEYIRKDPDGYARKAIESGSGEQMDRFLALWSEKLLDVDKLDKYIDLAAGIKNTEAGAALLQYKSVHYTVQELDVIEQNKQDKAIGIKEMTLADWRKIYKLSTSGDAATVSGYKGSDAVLEIPGRVGKYRVTAIGKSAFALCDDLVSVTIPEGVLSIGEKAFLGCGKLTDIVIPSGVESIGYWAFQFCENLVSVTIPASVTSIGVRVFDRCPNVTIHAPAGSYAEQYAKRASIPFEAI